MDAGIGCFDVIGLVFMVLDEEMRAEALVLVGAVAATTDAAGAGAFDFMVDGGGNLASAAVDESGVFGNGFCGVNGDPVGTIFWPVVSISTSPAHDAMDATGAMCGVYEIHY